MASERAMHGALGRSLAALTIGFADTQAERETALASQMASDMSQVVQLTAAGLARARPIWTEGDVEFPYPFVQHIDGSAADSALSNPHFAVGVELLTSGHVILDAQVRGWNLSDEGWITGARVRVSAWAPSSPKRVRYSAVIHLTFSGYAAPTDDESEA